MGYCLFCRVNFSPESTYLHCCCCCLAIQKDSWILSWSSSWRRRRHGNVTILEAGTYIHNSSNNPLVSTKHRRSPWQFTNKFSLYSLDLCSVLFESCFSFWGELYVTNANWSTFPWHLWKALTEKEKSSSIISTSMSFDDFGVKMQRKHKYFFYHLFAHCHEIWADH